MPHPIIDGGKEAAILHEMLLKNECRSNHTTVAAVDEVTEAFHTFAYAEHMMPDGTVSEVSYVSLRLIHPLV